MIPFSVPCPCCIGGGGRREECLPLFVSDASAGGDGGGFSRFEIALAIAIASTVPTNSTTSVMLPSSSLPSPSAYKNMIWTVKEKI